MSGNTIKNIRKHGDSFAQKVGLITVVEEDLILDNTLVTAGATILANGNTKVGIIKGSGKINGASSIRIAVSAKTANFLVGDSLTLKLFKTDPNLGVGGSQVGADITVALPAVADGYTQFVEAADNSSYINSAEYYTLTGSISATVGCLLTIYVEKIGGSSASNKSIAISGDTFIDGSSSVTVSGSVVNATGGEPYTDGEIVPDAVNEYGEKLEAGYDRSADAKRVTDINPKNRKRIPLNNFMTFATSAVAQTDYIDMALHDHLTFQFSLTVGLLTITFAGALLDDGTADSSCTYADITDDVVGAATYVVDATVAPVYLTLADVSGIFGEYKYIRVIATPTGASTGVIHARKKVI